MSRLFALVGFALTVICLLKVSGEISPKLRPLILTGAAVIFFAFLFTLLSPLYTYLSSLFEKSGFSPYLSVLMKGAGLGILTEICSSLCRSFGEDSVASWLEAAGKCAILALSLPLVGDVVDMIGELTT